MSAGDLAGWRGCDLQIPQVMFRSTLHSQLPPVLGGLPKQPSGFVYPRRGYVPEAGRAPLGGSNNAEVRQAGGDTFCDAVR